MLPRGAGELPAAPAEGASWMMAAWGGGGGRL